VWLWRGPTPAITRLLYLRPHLTKRLSARHSRGPHRRAALLPGGRPFHRSHQRPRGVSWPAVARGPSPLHRHLPVDVSFLCRCHGSYPCPLSGPRCRGEGGVSSALEGPSAASRRRAPRIFSSLPLN